MGPPLATFVPFGTKVATRKRTKLSNYAIPVTVQCGGLRSSLCPLLSPEVRETLLRLIKDDVRQVSRGASQGPRAAREQGELG